ncbi:MAG: permease prefix domain 1-containing protein [Candidatus Izemoplasma sp.]|nr:permease prefix domain 1-containing protein [Candidatus Izemoplasma sp.]
MKQIDNFVKHTFKHVPIEERKEIIEQVTEILNEKVDDLMDKGYSEQEAIDKTVLEFGTAEDYYDAGDYSFKKPKTIARYRNDFLFSLFGALIIIAMLVFTDLYYTRQTIWFVLPTLAVLWWPLATLYRFLNRKDQGE